MRENDVVDEFYQGFNEEYEKYSENYASYSRDYENYSNNYMTYMKNYAIYSENHASYIEQAKTRSDFDEHKMNKGVIRGLIPVDASSQYKKIEPEPLYSIFSKKFPRPYPFSSPPSYPLWLASKLLQNIPLSLHHQIPATKRTEVEVAINTCITEMERILSEKDPIDENTAQKSTSTESNQLTTRPVPPIPQAFDIFELGRRLVIPTRPACGRPPGPPPVPSGGFNFSKIPDNPELPTPPSITENASARTKEKITS